MAGSGALASRLGSKDHLRVNSSVHRRGQRMSKRDMSAQRTEESSRQSLQIMQPAGLNNSSQRTRNLSGTVRQARKLLLQIEYPASLTTRQRSVVRQSGGQDQSPRISDQLVVGPAGDAAALRLLYLVPRPLRISPDPWSHIATPRHQPERNAVAAEHAERGSF